MSRRWYESQNVGKSQAIVMTRRRYIHRMAAPTPCPPNDTAACAQADSSAPRRETPRNNSGRASVAHGSLMSVRPGSAPASRYPIHHA
jgi:hypothetical protein